VCARACVRACVCETYVNNKVQSLLDIYIFSMIRISFMHIFLT